MSDDDGPPTRRTPAPPFDSALVIRALADDLAARLALEARSAERARDDDRAQLFESLSLRARAIALEARAATLRCPGEDRRRALKARWINLLAEATQG